MPAVAFPVSISSLPENLPPGLSRLVFWEEEKHMSMQDWVEHNERASGIVMAIGPEGGLTDSEISALVDNDFSAVSLGARILRTETVAPAMSAIVQFAFGDLGKRRELV